MIIVFFFLEDVMKERKAHVQAIFFLEKFKDKAAAKICLFPVSRPTHFLDKIHLFCPTYLLYSS